MRSLLAITWMFIEFVNGNDYLLDTRIGRLRGIIEDTTFNGQTRQIVKFLGIPFAEPPISQLRFKKPVPITQPFTKEYNATFMRPVCPQQQNPRYTMPISEDCLFLNVFVPLNSLRNGTAGNIQPAAVMIWIFGGGYITGGNTYYDGSILSAFHEIIVVTINYRVGLLGFLSTHDSASPGNYGLWDQHLGIKWTNDNIHAFNGDAKRVTIFGQSAGAASVLQQALYPGNKRLFQSVIAESGSPLGPWALSKAGGYMDRYVKALAALLGCNGTWSYTLVNCLRIKPYTDIIKRMDETDSNGYGDVGNTFSPVVDGEFLKISPVKIYQNTHVGAQESLHFYRSLNILTGINDQDGLPFVAGRVPIWAGNATITNGVSRYLFENKEIPLLLKGLFDSDDAILDTAVAQEYTDWLHPNNKTVILQKMVELETDVEILLPTIRTLKSHAVVNPVASYFYVFSHKPSTTTEYYITGANHADELPFVFGVPPYLYNLVKPHITNAPRQEILLSQFIMTMWTNFAKTGDPNKPVSLKPFFPGTWPKYDVTSQSYLDINTNMTLDSVKQRYAAERVAFWERLVPAILKAIKESGPASAHSDPSSMFVG